MGKSTTSCFRIITCGSDSVDNDDLRARESKVSSGRNGWSFRKTSARHQVLSNTVISEAPSAAEKESPESTDANFHVLPNLTVPEKTSLIQWTEQKDNLSAQIDSNLPDIVAAKGDDCSANATLDESSIISIQAALRGYLARRALLKQKNVIKLQAAIRGHLVRRHAVGTLRCIQAIVKMQSLVRARHARPLVEGSGDFEKQKKNSAKGNLDPTVLRGKREAKPNGAHTYTCIEKLLSNRFAGQLMESTPKPKPINIKCDPLKPDSAWKWLERWTLASSNEEPCESGSAPEQHAKETLGYSSGKGVNLLPSDSHYEFKDFLGPSTETSENDENSITYDADNLDIHMRSSVHIRKETDLMSKVECEFVQLKDETGNGQPEIAVSECGTELSITSTLDSPDISVGGVNNLEQDLKILDVTDHPKSRASEIEANVNTSILGTELSYDNVNQFEAHEIVHSVPGECVDYSAIVSDSSPESQATPSTKVSVNPKESGPSLKKRSLSADKREELQKEDKIGKRQNSFGSAKLDQEPRDSTSSNSLPSYMQATESARAKAVLNGSPRSSPDVQDKDIFIKSRPSLHSTNGRLGSPRINRSPSKAQKSAKGNNIHSPQERKWRR